jgi:hypothetical protein
MELVSGGWSLAQLRRYAPAVRSLEYPVVEAMHGTDLTPAQMATLAPTLERLHPALATDVIDTALTHEQIDALVPILRAVRVQSGLLLITVVADWSPAQIGAHKHHLGSLSLDLLVYLYQYRSDLTVQHRIALVEREYRLSRHGALRGLEHL